MDGTGRREGLEEILAAVTHRELDPNLLRCTLRQRLRCTDDDTEDIGPQTYTKPVAAAEQHTLGDPVSVVLSVG